MGEDSRWRLGESDVFLILGLIVLGCALLGYVSGGSRNADGERLASGASGFDMRSAAGAPPPQPAPASSSLGVFALSEPERAGRETPPPPPAGAAQADAPAGLRETALKSGAKVSAFTANFKRAHPVMRDYSRQWLSHPDLKKLNDDYMRDRDQVKFVHGLAASRSFGPLVAKLASDPATHALAMDFVTGLVREVPADLMSAAAAAVGDDETIHRLVGNIAAAFGVPAAMLPGLAAAPGP